MTDKDRLQRELFATRQELAIQRIRRGTGICDPVSRLSYVPERDEDFLRLQILSIEELEKHVERLKRDIESIEPDTQATVPEEC